MVTSDDDDDDDGQHVDDNDDDKITMRGYIKMSTFWSMRLSLCYVLSSIFLSSPVSDILTW